MHILTTWHIPGTYQHTRSTQVILRLNPGLDQPDQRRTRFDETKEAQGSQNHPANHITPQKKRKPNNKPSPIKGFILGCGIGWFVIMSARRLSTFSPFQHVFSRFRSNNYAAKRLRNTFAQRMRQITYYQDQPPSWTVIRYYNFIQFPESSSFGVVGQILDARRKQAWKHGSHLCVNLSKRELCVAESSCSWSHSHTTFGET